MSTPEIVVIGGSAGALEPLLELVSALPDAFEIPIAIALHVGPTHPSILPALLGRLTRRPVHEIEDKLAFAPRRLYVAPSDYHILVERHRTFALSIDAPVNFSRPSIDVMFESAALALGPNVAGVILSGANDDGARGLASIRAAGGIAIVQDPACAQVAVMPEAARNRAGADVHVLAVPAIAGLFKQLTQVEGHAS